MEMCMDRGVQSVPSFNLSAVLLRWSADNSPTSTLVRLPQTSTVAGLYPIPLIQKLGKAAHKTD